MNNQEPASVNIPAGDPGPMFRIALPAILSGWRASRPRPTETPQLRDEFERHFGRYLRPMGEMDHRLTEAERELAAETRRIRDAILRK